MERSEDVCGTERPQIPPPAVSMDTLDKKV